MIRNMALICMAFTLCGCMHGLTKSPRKIVCFGDSLTSCGGEGGRYSDMLQDSLPDDQKFIFVGGQPGGPPKCVGTDGFKPLGKRQGGELDAVIKGIIGDCCDRIENELLQLQTVRKGILIDVCRRK